MEKPFKNSDVAESLRTLQSRFERASQRAEGMRQQCEQIGDASLAAYKLAEVLKNLGLESAHNIALVLGSNIDRAGNKQSMKYGIAENRCNAIECEIATQVADMLKVVGASKDCVEQRLSYSDEIPF